jgi:hypothetical protein
MYSRCRRDGALSHQPTHAAREEDERIALVGRVDVPNAGMPPRSVSLRSAPVE